MQHGRGFGIFFFLLIFLTYTPARAGHAEDDSTAVAPVPLGPWNIDLVSRLAASQTGFQNWAEGGANTLASEVSIESKIDRKTETWVQTHEVRMAVGVIKQDTLDLRKATDEIRIRSSFVYSGDGMFAKVKPTIASEISTQFAAGYNYTKNPFEGQDALPARVSGFFAPATFVQTLGFTYNRSEAFKQRFGVGAKQTVVVDEVIRVLYNMELDQPVRFELGLESRTHIDREVFENVRLRSSLGLFASFNKPDLPDLLWENEIDMKVNAWLGVRIGFKALYDRDVTNLLQLKESLSLGVSYDLI